MKKFVKGIVALLLMLSMGLACFGGCSSQGQTLMEIEESKISVNLFMLYLSRLKGELTSSYNFGTDALKDSFWDTVMDTKGTTYNKYYTEAILDNTKSRLAALHEFEVRGLELPKETINEIDEKLKKLMENDANGSKTAFNALLQPFGANYAVLREAYIIDAKIAYLKDNIYGADGSLIAKNLMDDYYEQNYARFKQIFFPTYDYVYETDENGDDIYYRKDGSICYDTSATKKLDSEGNPVKDAKGNTVYVTLDSLGKEHIAYDMKNGERVNVTDEDGSYIIADLTGEELQAVKDAAASTYSKTAAEDYTGFETLMDSGESYPNGYYITKSTTSVPNEIREDVFDMECGEVRTIISDYGIHIVMRYELEEDGYKKSANSDFFISTATGNFVFMNELKNQLLLSYLNQYKDKIIVDTAVLEGVDMKSVLPNYYY